MTEKRFKEVFPNIIESNCSFTDNGKGITHKEVVDKLNELHEENKNLSKLNKILEGFLLDKGYDFKDIIKFLQERTDGRGDLE